MKDITVYRDNLMGPSCLVGDKTNEVDGTVLQVSDHIFDFIMNSSTAHLPQIQGFLEIHLLAVEQVNKILNNK